MKKPPSPKKAFTAYSKDDDGRTGADIIFCHSVNELRQSDEYTKVVRSPEYDDWSEIGFVPAGFLDLQGWSFTCWECEGSVDWDWDEDDVEDGEDPTPKYPVFCGRRAFCSSQCCKAYDDEREKVRSMSAIAKEQFDSLFPEATNTYSWIDSDGIAHIHFNFPGGEGRVTWGTDKPDTVTCEPQDLEAWKTYRERVNQNSDRTLG